MLVMKLTAVLSARCHDMLGIFAGFSGSHCCVMRSAIRLRNPKALKASSAARYCFQFISLSAETAVIR